MISARDELLHVVSCLSDEECEVALGLLAPLTGGELAPPGTEEGAR